MMKRLVTLLFFLLLGLGVLAVTLPNFMDWNKRKDVIVSQIEARLGQKVTLGGNVSLKILPNPQILLEDLRIGETAGEEPLIRLSKLEARLKLKPLLEGRYEVDRLALKEPRIYLLVRPDGTENWSVLRQEQEAAPRASLPGQRILLDRFAISEATIDYVNQMTGGGFKARNLNLDIEASTLAGPYRMRGDMLYDAEPVNVEIDLGAYKPRSDMALRMAFQPIDKLPEMIFDGIINMESGVKLKGGIRVDKGTLASLFSSDDLSSVPSFTQEVELKADMDLSASQIRLKKIDARFADGATAKGALDIALTRGNRPEVTADLEVAKIRLSDRRDYPAVPKTFGGSFNVKGRDIVWGPWRVPQATANLRTHQDEWVVKQATLVYPGNSRFDLQGLITPSSNSAVTSLRLTSDDIGKLYPGLPFGKLEMKATLDMVADNVLIDKIEAQPEGQGAVTGDIRFNPQVSPLVARVNLSGDLFKATGLSLAGEVAQGKLTGEAKAETVDFDALPYDRAMSLAITAQKAQWRGQALEDVSLQLESGEGKISATNIRAGLWQGALVADLSAEKGTGSVKGNLERADLSILGKELGLDGLQLAKGEAAFDLTGRDLQDKSLKGTLSLKTGQLTVEKFNPGALDALVGGFKAVPDDLKAQMTAALKSGDTAFRDVAVDFKAADGKLSAELKPLDYGTGRMTLKTGHALGSEDYALSAGVAPESDLPSFTVALPSYDFDDAPFAQYIMDKNPPPAPPPVIKPPAAAPEPQGDDAAAAAPETETEAPQDAATAPQEQPAPPATRTIDDIINSLDESPGAPAGESARTDENAPAPETPPADMPPQPLPVLPEMNVGEVVSPPSAPSASPPLQPQASNPPDAPLPGASLPDEIFPVEDGL